RWKRRALPNSPLRAVTLNSNKGWTRKCAPNFRPGDILSNCEATSAAQSVADKRFYVISHPESITALPIHARTGRPFLSWLNNFKNPKSETRNPNDNFGSRASLGFRISGFGLPSVGCYDAPPRFAAPFLACRLGRRIVNCRTN